MVGPLALAAAAAAPRVLAGEPRASAGVTAAGLVVVAAKKKNLL